MSLITTHILDIAQGRPAEGVRVNLARMDGQGTFQPVGTGVTNADGRVTDLLPEGDARAGSYRLSFFTAPYLQATGVVRPFFPEVTLHFIVVDPTQHYHVPLLLSPFGYSTYRGS